MDYIHDLRKIIGPRKIILNCAGALIIKEGKIIKTFKSSNRVLVEGVNIVKKHEIPRISTFPHQPLLLSHFKQQGLF